MKERKTDMFKLGEVVQFNENHKWCGCLGVINEIKYFDDDVRYMVGVPVPQQGTAFIYVMQSENAIEYIGRAVLVLAGHES